MASQYDLPYTGNQVEALLAKVTELEGEMPEKVSDLTNDAGYITAADLPTKTSDLTNDSGFITNAPVVAETARAQAAEALLATISSLQAEVTRATGVEGSLQDLIDAIAAKIPSAATSSNQLADKAFVNSSIATSTATFRGTYSSLSELEAVTADENDYGFVTSTDAAGNTVYKRYKYSGGSWVFEYDLNNSSFTAAQWAAINSAITSALVQKLSDLPDNTVLQAALAAKQNVIDDLSAIRSGATAGATAYQKPGTGIPKTDLESAVQTSLGKADTALQGSDITGLATKAEVEELAEEVDGKADIDGNYETLGAGTAKNLEGRSVVTDEFLVRTTGGDAEVANGLGQVTAVGGNSVKWNQILPILAANGPWNVKDVTMTNNKDGSYTFNGTATDNGAPDSNNRFSFPLDINHIYYLFVSHTDVRIGFSNLSISTTTLSGNLYSSAIFRPKRTGIQYSKLVVVKDVSYTNVTVSPFIIDLTLIFGAGNEPETLEEVEAWLEANVGLQAFYAYNPGTIINANMTGLESLGQNILDPTTGKAQLPGAYSDVYGNYYGITGTHGALTFTSALGETSTITPDSEGKFLIEVPGELTVATPGADCSVFLWWDGTRTEYTEYESNVAKLDVTHIYGKLNGEGELVQVWPTGMPGIGDLKDALREENGEVVAKKTYGEVDLGTRSYTKTTGNYFCAAISGMKTATANGVANILAYPYQAVSYNGLTGADKVMAGFTTNDQRRLYINDSAYAESDAAAFKTAMSGVKLIYELATPLTYTDLVYQGSELFEDGTPVELPVRYEMDNWGVERVLPQNTENILTAAPQLSVLYAIDAVEQLDTLRAEVENINAVGITVTDLRRNLASLAAYLCTTYPEVFDPPFTVNDTPNAGSKVFGYHETQNPEPEPEETTD